MYKTEKQKIITYAKRLLTSNLTVGTGGNLSIRSSQSDEILITPSGVEYEDLRPDLISVLKLDGTQISGEKEASTELPFHLALYRHRSDINAIVHTHSTYATVLACLGWEIPAVHYLVGFSGHRVPLAPYALFGSRELSQNIIETIGKRNAILLANHGLVAVGKDIETAFRVAEQIEFVAKVYYLAKCAGEPNLLSRTAMEHVLKKFKTYDYLIKKEK